MKVIKEPNKMIAGIWGAQVKKSVAYRLIRYIITQEVDEGLLVYHLVTGELILIEKTDNLDINLLPADVGTEWDELIHKRFLVPIEFDEMESVKQLRKIARKLRSNNKAITGYTIMPTSYCNARCFYCFEANFKHAHMSEETAKCLVEYMANHCGENKKVRITWFGGEPTVGYQRINQICNGLQEKGISYNSIMYSNGYLFDDKMIELAVNLWKINKIQITIDGTEKIYNKTKSFINNNINAYQKVLKNIKKLLDARIEVVVRMNMDFHNYDDLYLLIDELKMKFSQYSNFSSYVYVLFENDCYQIHRSENEYIELEKKKKRLDRKIIESNLMQGDNYFLPDLKFFSCCADNSNSLLIDPEGKIGKCNNYPYETIIGDIRSSSIDLDQCAFISETIKLKKCKECKLFPICYRLKICVSDHECNSYIIRQKENYIKKSMKMKYFQINKNYKMEDENEI